MTENSREGYKKRLDKVVDDSKKIAGKAHWTPPLPFFGKILDHCEEKVDDHQSVLANICNMPLNSDEVKASQQAEDRLNRTRDEIHVKQEMVKFSESVLRGVATNCPYLLGGSDPPQ
jgi:hypothetical protein